MIFFLNFFNSQSSKNERWQCIGVTNTWRKFSKSTHRYAKGVMIFFFRRVEFQGMGTGLMHANFRHNQTWNGAIIGSEFEDFSKTCCRLHHHHISSRILLKICMHEAGTHTLNSAHRKKKFITPMVNRSNTRILLLQKASARQLQWCVRHLGLSKLSILSGFCPIKDKERWKFKICHNVESRLGWSTMFCIAEK